MSIDLYDLTRTLERQVDRNIFLRTKTYLKLEERKELEEGIETAQNLEAIVAAWKLLDSQTIKELPKYKPRQIAHGGFLCAFIKRYGHNCLNRVHVEGAFCQVHKKIK